MSATKPSYLLNHFRGYTGQPLQNYDVNATYSLGGIVGTTGCELRQNRGILKQVRVVQYHIVV